MGLQSAILTPIAAILQVRLNSKILETICLFLFSNLIGVGSSLVRDQLHSRRSNWAEIFHKIVFWVL